MITYASLNHHSCVYLLDRLLSARSAPRLGPGPAGCRAGAAAAPGRSPTAPGQASHQPPARRPGRGPPAHPEVADSHGAATTVPRAHGSPRTSDPAGRKGSGAAGSASPAARRPPRAPPAAASPGSGRSHCRGAGGSGVFTARFFPRPAGVPGAP